LEELGSNTDGGTHLSDFWEVTSLCHANCFYSHWLIVQYSPPNVCEPAAGENIFFNLKVGAFFDQIIFWESAGISYEFAKDDEAVVGGFLFKPTAPQSLVSMEAHMCKA
jgi:hypothetical protein